MLGSFDGPHRTVHRRKVEVQLAGMFGLEGTYLQLKDEIAVEANVVEEKIDIKGLPVHAQRDLAPHERESASQLQEEVAKMGQ